MDVVEGYYLEDTLESAQSLSKKIGEQYSNRIQLFSQISEENQRQLLTRIQDELSEYNYFVQLVKSYDSTSFGNVIEADFNKNLNVFAPLLSEEE